MIIIGGHLIDIVRCSCGWESAPYYDGLEWAIQDWNAHYEEQTTPPQYKWYS